MGASFFGHSICEMLSTVVFLFLLKEFSCFLILPHSNETLVLPPFNGTDDEKPKFVKMGINSGKGDQPLYFDWRSENMVSPVKDQATCGACWAFSTVANIESHLKIYHDVEEILSEQFLIDCDEAAKGCKDAPILGTFAYIVATFGGVLRDLEYFPYVEERGQCRWKPSSQGSSDKYPKPVPVIGFQRVYPDEVEMARFVYEYGPLSAGINSASMARYTGGIDEPTEDECSPTKLNHAVLIVGYNVHVSPSGEQLPYWIIKNSWGTNWGHNGYYYLVRGRNACGITTDVSFAYV